MLSERKRFSFNVKYLNRENEQKQEQLNQFDIHFQLKNLASSSNQCPMSQKKPKQTRTHNTSVILPRIIDQYTSRINEREKGIKIINNLSFLADNSSVSEMTVIDNQFKMKTQRHISNQRDLKAKPRKALHKKSKQPKLTRNNSINTLNMEKYNELNSNFTKTIEQSLLKCNDIKCEIIQLSRNCYHYIDNQRM